MSVPRADVRFKLDDEWHKAAKVVSDVDGLDLGEYVELVVMTELRRRVHAATVIARSADVMGISGSNRELPGSARKGRE